MARVEAPPAAVRPGRGETVLVVEDDDAVRAIVSQTLASDGYHVVAARGPTEALVRARALGEGLALVVSDIVMPVMNGCELVAELTRERPALAVLFISGYSEEVASVSALLESGCELLRKPLSVDALRAKVGELLDSRVRRSGHQA